MLKGRRGAAFAYQRLKSHAGDELHGKEWDQTDLGSFLIP